MAINEFELTLSMQNKNSVYICYLSQFQQTGLRLYKLAFKNG